MKYVRRWRSHGVAEASSHAFHLFGIAVARFSLFLSFTFKVGRVIITTKMDMCVPTIKYEQSILAQQIEL